MNIVNEYRYTFGIRFAVIVRKREVAHAYLYLMPNDQHKQLLGLLEDLFVIESKRRQGYGQMLVNKIISEAKRHKCYKLIAISRHEREKAHKFYKDLGFKDHGKEFRMDFS